MKFYSSIVTKLEQNVDTKIVSLIENPNISTNFGPLFTNKMTDQFIEPPHTLSFTQYTECSPFNYKSGQRNVSLLVRIVRT